MTPRPPTPSLRWPGPALVAAVVLLLALPALAQPDPGDNREAAQFQVQGIEAFNRGDYARAEALFKQELRLNPGNFVPYYNIACARSMQAQTEGENSAGEWLTKAIEHGFIDVYQLKRDPNLRAARDGETYRKLIDNWGQIILAHRDDNIRIAAKLFDDRRARYQQVDDDALRLSYLSAFEQGSFEQARAEIARLAAWGISDIFTDLSPPAPGATEPTAPAAPAPENFDAWVVVVLPTESDFRKWALVTYGRDAITGTSGVGGAYNHDTKRLVAQDLGATLRHEFFHVLHWRSTTRLGQDHPVWIQEGLCSLVEDYRLDGDKVIPVPSWRTNMTKRRLRGGNLLPLKVLATMPRDRFVGSNPLANYGQARSLFLYLYDQGKLKDWYAAYTAGYAQDPTGVRALEQVLGADIEDVDKSFREWLRALPEVADANRPGEAGLGVETDPGNGEGPVIAVIARRSAAGRTGLKLGDVITAIDGKPTRDYQELFRILGEYSVGDEVEVAYRRGKIHGTAKVKLTTR